MRGDHFLDDVNAGIVDAVGYELRSCVEVSAAEIYYVFYVRVSVNESLD